MFSPISRNTNYIYIYIERERERERERVKISKRHGRNATMGPHPVIQGQQNTLYIRKVGNSTPSKTVLFLSCHKFHMTQRHSLPNLSYSMAMKTPLPAHSKRSITDLGINWVIPNNAKTNYHISVAKE